MDLDRRLILPVIVVLAGLVGCGDSEAPPTPQVPTLPAEMPPLNCADFEPAPVAKPAEKFVARRCTDPDGSIRWISSFYQCTDGSVWPVLSKDQGPVDGEPVGAAFDACVGR